MREIHFPEPPCLLLSGNSFLLSCLIRPGSKGRLHYINTGMPLVTLLTSHTPKAGGLFDGPVSENCFSNLTSEMRASIQQRSVIRELGKLWHNPNCAGSQGLVTHQQIDIIAITMIASRPQYRGGKNIVCPWHQSLLREIYSSRKPVNTRLLSQSIKREVLRTNRNRRTEKLGETIEREWCYVSKWGYTGTVNWS